MSTAKAIANVMKGLGFPVIAYCEPDQEADGQIMVTPKHHIQVGADYVIAVREHPDGSYRFGTTFYHHRLGACLLELKEHLANHPA